jgi:hypothetical protein
MLDSTENNEGAFLKARLVPLDDLIALERNPKDHDIGEITESIDRFGFLERVLVNELTGHILAGHGRIDTLKIMRHRGLEPPEGIVLNSAEEWIVPADYTRIPEDEEEAVAIALNRLTERGGWNEDSLYSVLSDLALQGEHMLNGIGYDLQDVDELRERLMPPDESFLDGYGEEDGSMSDDELSDQWLVLVECMDEHEQLDVLDQLTRLGMKARALIG